MEGDDHNDDAMSNMEEEHDTMLQLLNERMQLQWGQALLAGSAFIQSSIDTKASGVAEHVQEEDSVNQTELSFFRLFNSKPSTSTTSDAVDGEELPRVRLQSPSSLTLINGRSLNRILAVEDETKALVKERRRNIKAAAVDADWIISTSSASHWSSHPQPSRKLITKSLLNPSHTRLPLANIAIAYFPSPKSARTSSKIRFNVETDGRIKLKTYPDLGQERLEDRIVKNAKKKAAMMEKEARSSRAKVLKKEKIAEEKKTRLKRKSKKKRTHERQAGKT